MYKVAGSQSEETYAFIAQKLFNGKISTEENKQKHHAESQTHTHTRTYILSFSISVTYFRDCIKDKTNPFESYGCIITSTVQNAIFRSSIEFHNFVIDCNRLVV